MEEKRKIIFHRIFGWENWAKSAKMRYFGAFFAIFERFRFTWNTTNKTNCSTWNIYFYAIFHPFGGVSHETPILLCFCNFQWNYSILWNVGFMWICRISLHCRALFEEFFRRKCLAKQFVHLDFAINKRSFWFLLRIYAGFVSIFVL